MALAAVVFGLFTPFLVFDPHVRSEAPDLRALVTEGVARSATIARLVDRLQASDVIAYVEYGYAMSHDEAGSVSFLSAAGGRRYLKIRIRWDLLRKHQLMATHPETGIAHNRVLERRDRSCRIRKHEVGARLALWELLPDPRHEPAVVFIPVDSPERSAWLIPLGCQPQR